MISIPLFLDSEHSCSYLDQHQAQFAYVHPDFDLDTGIYSALIEQGFRRSGEYAYQPSCKNCNACVSTKLIAADFKPSRQQRRTLAKNTDIQATIKNSQFDPAHFALYQRYLQSRHADGEMENSSEEDYQHFFGSQWCHTLFVEFNINDELAAVAVIDQLDNALSAVYTFFDPNFPRVAWGFMRFYGK